MSFKNVFVLITIAGLFLSNSFNKVNSIPIGGRQRNGSIINPGRSGRYIRGVVIRPGYSERVNVIQATFDLEVGLGEASFMNFLK